MSLEASIEDASSLLEMDIVVVVRVVKVVIAEGCREAYKFSLMSTGQKTSPSRVAGPPVSSPSPPWLALVIESSVLLGVVDVVVVVIIAEVDVRTKVVGEPLELKWLMKVE